MNTSPNISYDYYRIFYHVAKYGSFTRAAEALLNSQSNLTRSVANLEHALGCRLFVRSNRGVRLTPEGERLYVHVAAAIAQLQAGEAEVLQNQGLQEGCVSIGASETALHLLLLERIRAFRLRFPGIRLRISNHSTPQAVTALKNGLADFSVVTSPVGCRPPLKELPLSAFREVLVGGPSFGPLSSEPKTLEELSSLPLISLDSRTKTYEFYSSFFMSQGLSFSPDMEAATTDQLLLLVKADLGIGFLPEPFAAKAAQAGEIVLIPLLHEPPERRICLLLDSERPLSVAAQKMAEFLQTGRL